MEVLSPPLGFAHPPVPLPKTSRHNTFVFVFVFVLVEALPWALLTHYQRRLATIQLYLYLIAGFQNASEIMLLSLFPI